MAILTLDEAKAHLKVSGADEDAEITLLIDATEDYLGRIGCPTDADPVSPALKAAALIGVQQLYSTGGDIGLTRDEVEDIGVRSFDHAAADKVLSTCLGRLIASVREITI